MKQLINIISIVFLLTSKSVHGQIKSDPFIKLIQPTKENQVVKSSKQYIVGSTCKTCSLTINNNTVKVYASGAFAYEINLITGDTSIIITATNSDNKVVSKKINYNYTLPKPADTVKTLSIASIEIFPEGNLYVKAGDRIKFKVKALPNCRVLANGTIPLYEMPTSIQNKMPGIYQGEYMVKETDSFL